MSSPERVRKGWGGFARILLLAIQTGIVMIPVVFVLGAVLTPALWRLESVLGIELAGHSGPADWLSWSIWGAFTASVTAWLARRRITTR